MAYCDKCGNFDDSHIDGQIDMFKNDPDYQPDLQVDRSPVNPRNGNYQNFHTCHNMPLC